MPESSAGDHIAVMCSLMRASVDGGNQVEVDWRDCMIGGARAGYVGGRAMRRWRGGSTERVAEREGTSAGTGKEGEER